MNVFFLKYIYIYFTSWAPYLMQTFYGTFYDQSVLIQKEPTFTKSPPSPCELSCHIYNNLALLPAGVSVSPPLGWCLTQR